MTASQQKQTKSSRNGYRVPQELLSSFKDLPFGYAKTVSDRLNCDHWRVYRVRHGKIYCEETLLILVELVEAELLKRKKLVERLKLLKHAEA